MEESAFEGCLKSAKIRLLAICDSAMLPLQSFILSVFFNWKKSLKDQKELQFSSSILVRVQRLILNLQSSKETFWHINFSKSLRQILLCQMKENILHINHSNLIQSVLPVYARFTLRLIFHADCRQIFLRYQTQNYKLDVQCVIMTILCRRLQRDLYILFSVFNVMQC